jgi:hypothetical protein
VGCDSNGVNAFFVRADLLARAGLRGEDPRAVYAEHPVRTRVAPLAEQMASLERRLRIVDPDPGD